MEDEYSPEQVEQRVLARLETVLREELAHLQSLAAAVDARAQAVADREASVRHRARVVDDELGALDAARAAAIDDIERMQRIAAARDLASRQRVSDIVRRETALIAKENEIAALQRDLDRSFAENRRLSARLAALEAWMADQGGAQKEHTA